VKEYQEAYAETGEDNQQKYLPVPATYIIDQDGIVEYVYFDPNYKVRVSIADLLTEL
jgi:peroxiredoxin